MRRVAGELDAVVGANGDGHELDPVRAGRYRGLRPKHAARIRHGTVATTNHVGAILDRVISMYEACNFQDLTGQPHLEDRQCAEIRRGTSRQDDRRLGGGLEAFRKIADTQTDGLPALGDERSLLNGPRLDEDDGHVDQGDIDALFD